jgi:hypothetical protein
MRRKRVKEKTSIVTVVSFGGSSKKELKIAMAHTVGSTVTLTTLGGISRDGTNFIPSPALRRMLEINGPRATEANTEIGESNDKSE